jgi:hypothetical protein
MGGKVPTTTKFIENKRKVKYKKEGTRPNSNYIK